jgi:hypothetical protein
MERGALLRENHGLRWRSNVPRCKNCKWYHCRFPGNIAPAIKGFLRTLFSFQPLISRYTVANALAAND